MQPLSVVLTGNDKSGGSSGENVLHVLPTFHITGQGTATVFIHSSERPMSQLKPPSLRTGLDLNLFITRPNDQLITDGEATYLV